MGLDMFLHAYKGDKEEIDKKIDKEWRKPDFKWDNYTKICEESGKKEVGYWRKFNALHNWFVLKVQDGVDDCDSYPVDKNDLQELLLDLKEVVSAGEPTDNFRPTSGFFFGSTEVDEWFWDDVRETIEHIEKLLEEGLDDEVELYYRASW